MKRAYTHIGVVAVPPDPNCVMAEPAAAAPTIDLCAHEPSEVSISIKGVSLATLTSPFDEQPSALAGRIGEAVASALGVVR